MIIQPSSFIIVNVAVRVDDLLSLYSCFPIFILPAKAVLDGIISAPSSFIIVNAGSPRDVVCTRSNWQKAQEHITY